MANGTLKPRICDQCGATFPPNAPGQRRCSSRCAALVDAARKAAAKKPPTKRACLRCGSKFFPAKGNHVFCSARCREQTSNAKAMAARHVEVATRPALLGRTCVSCGAAFTPKVKASTRCSRQCISRDSDRKMKGRKPAKQPQVRAARQCRYCSADFTPARRAAQVYCTTECQRAGKPRMTSAEQAARYAKRRGGVLPAAVACHRCGELFKPFSVVSRWCSKRCRARAKDAQRAHRWKIKRQKIYDRDRGLCLLCGLPVDLTIAYPDPKAFTIDHIVPVTAGGGDEETNLQTAHMDCNARKGGVIRWRLAIQPLPSEARVSA